MIRRAIAPGTFDPVHVGHVILFKLAAAAFDELTVLLVTNPKKAHRATMFSLDERVEMLRSELSFLPNVVIDTTDGEMATYCTDHDAGYIVRGIRDAADLEPELKLVDINRRFAPEVVTVFFPVAHNFTSSTAVKAALARGEDISALCSEGVIARLRAHTASQQTR